MLISSFLCDRKYRVLVEGEMSMPQEIQEGFCPATILYNLYTNDALETPGVHLALFADDTCICPTDYKECYVLRKLQHSCTSMESWCEHLNIQINEH